jgi:hypothetical protein
MHIFLLYGLDLYDRRTRFDFFKFHRDFGLLLVVSLKIATVRRGDGELSRNDSWFVVREGGFLLVFQILLKDEVYLLQTF